jgi:hypothetical protein
MIRIWDGIKQIELHNNKEIKIQLDNLIAINYFVRRTRIYLMKFSLLNKDLKIPINWAYALAFCVIWSYGYQGAINIKEWYVQLPISLYFLCVLVVLLIIGKTILKSSIYGL